MRQRTLAVAPSPDSDPALSIEVVRFCEGMVATILRPLDAFEHPLVQADFRL